MMPSSLKLLRLATVAALVLGFLRFAPAAYCGRDAFRWFKGEEALQLDLARHLIRFETEDDGRAAERSGSRFVGEWALVTHQMTALGLAQIALAHPEHKGELLPTITSAAIKSFAPEMRDFGTEAWGEDALSSLTSSRGHAYLAYPALAVGMARLLGGQLPPQLVKQHDVLIASYERRLLASPTGLIDTYPGEAYPTDVAAVAAAIAVHGRVTGVDHAPVLRKWARLVRERQIDRESGFVIQRMGAQDGKPHDAPRGSGTALGAYFAGFADQSLSRELAAAVFRHESTLMGFSGLREYADGYFGFGDVDSGPVVLGVSVSGTGFALASARAHDRPEVFARLYRTTELFGVSHHGRGETRFLTGGPIGNALLLALLTSGPELFRL